MSLRTLVYGVAGLVVLASVSSAWAQFSTGSGGSGTGGSGSGGSGTGGMGSGGSGATFGSDTPSFSPNAGVEAGSTLGVNTSMGRTSDSFISRSVTRPNFSTGFIGTSAADVNPAMMGATTTTSGSGSGVSRSSGFTGTGGSGSTGSRTQGSYSTMGGSTMGGSGMGGSSMGGTYSTMGGSGMGSRGTGMGSMGMGSTGMGSMGMGMGGTGMGGTGMGMGSMGMGSMGSRGMGSMGMGSMGMGGMGSRGMGSMGMGSMGMGSMGSMGMGGMGMGGRSQYGQYGSTTGRSNVPLRNQVALVPDARTPVLANTAQLNAATSTSLAGALKAQLNSPLEVVMQADTAILRGAVATAYDRALAEQFVRLEPGIGQVRNELVVAPASSRASPPAAPSSSSAAPGSP